MKRSKTGSTIKQYAYATHMLSGNAKSKKEAALLSGYTPTMAENAKAKIEDTEGYKNAIIVLAGKSNNIMLKVMTELDTRGFDDFSNKDLVSALNAIGAAWERIEKHRAPNKLQTPEGNPLRALLMRRTEVAVIEPSPNGVVPPEFSASANKEEPKDATYQEVEDDPNDF